MQDIMSGKGKRSDLCVTGGGVRDMRLRLLWVAGCGLTELLVCVQSISGSRPSTTDLTSSV